MPKGPRQVPRGGKLAPLLGGSSSASSAAASSSSTSTSTSASRPYETSATVSSMLLELKSLIRQTQVCVCARASVRPCPFVARVRCGMGDWLSRIVLSVHIYLKGQAVFSNIMPLTVILTSSLPSYSRNVVLKCYHSLHPCVLISMKMSKGHHPLITSAAWQGVPL